uniref:Uncharacterized protein n=1 Tax=Helianthus annuus TaxID=4232 RepID=A0A251SCW5_HELAN
MVKPNSCPQPKPPTQAPPYPMGVGLSLFSTCQLMPPKLTPTIPHSLKVYEFLFEYRGCKFHHQG